MRTALTIAALILAAYATPAQAATAYLITCNSATSATGRLIYVGTYDYAGVTLTYTFEKYCPNSIEIE